MAQPLAIGQLEARGHAAPWPVSTVAALVLVLVASSGLTACRDGARGAGVPPGRSVSTVLAELPEVVRPPEPAPRVVGLHQPASSEPTAFDFAARGAAVAMRIERGREVEVVHAGKVGKRHAAVGAIALSPDGRRCAYAALDGARWSVVLDGQEGPRYSAIRRPVFSSDGAHLAYQALEGERWLMVVDGVVVAATPTRYLQHAFSGDGRRLVYVDDVDDGGKGRLVVLDLATKAPAVIATGVETFALDAAGGRVTSAAGPDGQRYVVSCALDRPAQVQRGPPYRSVTEPALGLEGGPSYAAEREGGWLLVAGAMEAPLPPGEFVVYGPVPRPDGTGLAVAVASSSTGQVLVRRLDSGGWQVGPPYQEVEGLAWDDVGASLAYAARRDGRWRLVVDGREGPPHDRVVSPTFLPGGKGIVYRARQGGGRFVVLAGLDGATRRQSPPREQVFPVSITAGGAGLAYGSKDGARLTWNEEPL